MKDTRRDQLIEFVEKEFIGPDPIDWPGMTQSNGEEILTTDPPRTRYIAGILFPRETKDTDVDTREGESEPLGDTEGDDPGIVEEKKTNGESVEFLENAEELINRSNAYRQSAISLTVCANKDDTIRVEVSAGVYSTMTATDPKTEKRLQHIQERQLHGIMKVTHWPYQHQNTGIFRLRLHLPVCSLISHIVTVWEIVLFTHLRLKTQNPKPAKQ